MAIKFIFNNYFFVPVRISEFTDIPRASREAWYIYIYNSKEIRRLAENFTLYLPLMRFLTEIQELQHRRKKYMDRKDYGER